LPITVHSNPSKTKAGSRHYIHAKDVAEGILHILNLKGPFENDFGNAKCPKFNLVGAEEIDNLTLAKKIADVMKATHAKYEMVDFHSARPGHDLRYSLSGEYMKSLGWQPRITLSERIEQVVNWTLENDRWLK
jgi:dTDP-glucose 4,6-dehydratase